MLLESIGDLLTEQPVDVTPIAASAVLRNDFTPQPADPTIKTQPRNMKLIKYLSTVEHSYQ